MGYTYTEFDSDRQYRKNAYMPDEAEEIDDDNILSEIDGRDEVREKPRKAKTRKQKPKKEPKPVEGKGRRGRGAIIAAVAMVAVVFAGELFAMNYAKDNKLFPFEEKEKPNYSALGTSYSSENITARIDNSMAEYYRFLLLGDHEAIGEAGTQLASFSFGAGDGFTGHSSAGNDSQGIYEVTTRDGKYLLVTTCGDTVDTYEMEISDQNDLVLKNGSETYTLR